jgi:broad-specificity NMP kinase
MMEQHIQMYLANKLASNGLFGDIIKILLLTNYKKVFDLLEPILNKIIYILKDWVYVLKRKLNLNNYKYLTIKINQLHQDYEDLISYFETRDTILIDYVKNEDFIVKNVKSIDDTIVHDNLNISFKFVETDIVVTLYDTKRTPLQMENTFNSFMKSTFEKNKNKIRICVTLEKLGNSNYNRLIAFLTNHITIHSRENKQKKFIGVDNNNKYAILDESSYIVTNLLSNNVTYFVEKKEDVNIYFKRIEKDYSELSCSFSNEKNNDYETLSKFLLEYVSTVCKTESTKNDFKLKIYDKSSKLQNTFDYKPTIFLNKKDAIMTEKIIHLFNNENDSLKKKGFINKLSILLYGPAGTGKTTWIKYFAFCLQKNIKMVDISKVKSNQELDDILKTDCIVVMEELDKMLDESFKTTETTTYSQSNDELMKGLSSTTEGNKQTTVVKNTDRLSLDHVMQKLDGLISSNNQIFIFTSNFPQKIVDYCDALIRPGRVDYAIKIDYCSFYQFTSICQDFFEVEVKEDKQEQFEKFGKIITSTITTALVYLKKHENDYPSGITIDDIFDIISKYCTFSLAMTQ